MALTGLLDIDDLDELMAFWERREIRRTSDEVIGTADGETRLRITEGGAGSEAAGLE